MRKSVGWLDHKWALAFFGGILSCIFIMMQLNNEANIFNIMNFVDDNIWYVIFVVTLVISVILFIRHIFFTKKVLVKYDSI